VEDERPARPWHVFATYGAAVALSIATTMVAILFLLETYPDVPYATLVQMLPGLLVGSVAVSSGLLLALLFFVRPLSAARFRLVPGWETGPTLAVMSLGVLALSQAMSSVAELLGLGDEGSLGLFRRAIERAEGPDLFAAVLVLGIGASTAEEIFFRGYMQWQLREHWSPLTAVLVTSAAFSILHVSPVHVVLAFVLALYLGFVAEISGSTLPSIVCHVVNNVIVTLQPALGFEVIGRDANMLAAALGVVLVTGCVLWLRRTTPGATPA
jgi:uncharacterized protein